MTSKPKPPVFLQQKEWDVPFSHKIVFENAIDHRHVPFVHSDTEKNCQVLLELGNVKILIFEMIPFRWFPFYIKRFLAIQKVDGESTEVRYLSLPVSTSMVSFLTIKTKPLSGNPKEGRLEHTFRLRLSKWWRPFAKFLLYLRNQGELRRWKQDYNLMRERNAAIQSGHVDNPRCLIRHSLFEEWFGEHF